MMNASSNINVGLLALLLAVYCVRISAAACLQNQTELIIAYTNHTPSISVGDADVQLLTDVQLFSDNGTNIYRSPGGGRYEDYSRKWDKKLCVATKEDGCHALQMTLVDYDGRVGRNATPDSFIVTYGGKEAPLRGPYLYGYGGGSGDESKSFVADLGTCADTICGEGEAIFEIEGNSKLDIDWWVLDALTGERVLDCPNSLIEGSYYGNNGEINGPCSWGYTASSFSRTVQTARTCLPKNNCYTFVIGTKENYSALETQAIVTASYDGNSIGTFDNQHFAAIDFGSESSCEVASCPENDESKLELFFFTEEGEEDRPDYVANGWVYVPEPKPNISWSVTNHTDIVLSGLLEKPHVGEGLSYFHYHRECIQQSSCLKFQLKTLYEEKEGDRGYSERVAQRIAIDGVIFSDEDMPFGWSEQYSFLLGKCDANVCGEDESLFEVSVLSGSTAPWEYEEPDRYEFDMNGFFFDEKKSINSGNLMHPDSMDYRNFMAFSLEWKRLPSRTYRHLRCVETQDSCVGLAMSKSAAEHYIDSGVIAVSVTVDGVLIGGLTAGGPCKSDAEGDCNYYYTTETVGNCQTTLSVGAIAGISIGCVAFVLIIACLIFYQRKKKKNENRTAGTESTVPATVPEVVAEPTQPAVSTTFPVAAVIEPEPT